MRRPQAKHGRAGCLGGRDAGGRILHDQAAARVHAQQLSRSQVRVGRRFAVLDVVDADQRVRQRQASRL